MSDVQQQLRVVIQEVAERRHAECEAASSTDVADAILERFDVTPKPVVSDHDLGGMVSMALVNAGLIYRGYSDDCSHKSDIGRKLADQLEFAGLKIVRATDE